MLIVYRLFMTKLSAFFKFAFKFVAKIFAGGLILWVSPLFAQDYIDVEAERRQAEQEAERQTYPSSGYQDPQPIQQGYPSDTQTVPVNPTPIAGGSDPGELYYQLQLLQQEVMELRGRVEEQEYQLRQLREQSLERYLDIDKRLKEGGVATGGDGTTTTAPTPTVPGTAPAQPLAGEADAYRAAYSLVRGQQFSQAVEAFRQFLVDYPGGRYAPNAHYWLGELYLVIVPPDDESARREFNLLLEQYPNNSKVPDALYKLGKIYYDRGNRDRSKEYLERVVNEFGGSGSSAVKLATDFLSRNF